jgi:fructose-bisphosphate aldolase class II
MSNQKVGNHDLMHRTLAQKFAVGAFNVDNIEIFKAIVAAAKKKHSPVLVEVSQGEVEFLGYKNIVDMVQNARDEGAEIYLNLDHAPSFEAAKTGIEYGFEFVHIDVSKRASLEENMDITSQVVKLAHPKNILVESEMEYFSGSSNVHKEDISIEEVKSHYTKPDEAKEFVEKTGVDIFAASIGNLHGLYPTPKTLDIELLKKIREKLDCYISLHGGSGTPAHFFREAVKVGVSKININSEMRRAFRTNLEKTLKDNPDEYAVPKIEGPVIEAVQKVVEEHMDIFGSTGKAVS